ncbi:MAG: hypothetical protein KC417_02435 [Myxococcales bacterium]|nr:hypothetical protein [Myxococcales bacterium]
MVDARATLRPAAPRDQDPSPLTEILREVAEVDSAVLASVFVDAEGECIDYWSALEPFDAKLCAAQMVVMLDSMSQRLGKVGQGAIAEVEILTETCLYVLRRVTDEYMLVVAYEPVDRERHDFEAVERAVARLRDDASLEIPPWELPRSQVHVETSPGAVWANAPSAFTERGTRVEVLDVIGRWEADGVECFRVRTDDGREITLAYEPEGERWSRLEADHE